MWDGLKGEKLRVTSFDTMLFRITDVSATVILPSMTCQPCHFAYSVLTTAFLPATLIRLSTLATMSIRLLLLLLSNLA